MYKRIKYSQVLKQFENGVYNRHITFGAPDNVIRRGTRGAPAVVQARSLVAPIMRQEELEVEELLRIQREEEEMDENMELLPPIDAVPS